MAVTRFGLEGYGVRRAGSFAGKTATEGGPHPVGILTRFGLEGYGVRRAGSFAGKTGTEPPPVTVTTSTQGSGPGWHLFGQHPVRRRTKRVADLEDEIRDLIARADDAETPKERRDAVRELKAIVSEVVAEAPPDYAASLQLLQRIDGAVAYVEQLRRIMQQEEDDMEAIRVIMGLA